MTVHVCFLDISLPADQFITVASATSTVAVAIYWELHNAESLNFILFSARGVLRILHNECEHIL